MQSNKPLCIFLVLVVVLNVLQSFCTELLHDEAYYWFWSTNLAWGYFDHPPMVALFIYLGDSMFHHEVGVRLISVLSHVATIYLLFRLVNPANVYLYIALLMSITPFLGAGFFAVPDAPLLLFTTCFYFAYKRYLQSDSLTNLLLLGVCMALMLYSKYHGVLVLALVIFSNLELLKQRSFYFATAIGVLCFAPHLWWQWQHDFPTLRFHFFERAKDVYSLWLTGEYIGGQLLMAGVPAGILLLYASAKQVATNKLERTLKFQLWGIYLFFLISTIKGKTEAHWTAVNIIPLTVFGYRYLETNLTTKKWLYRLLPFSVLALLLIRIHYGTELTQRYLKIPSETQHWKNWAQTIASDAGNLPVVFFSSYSRAAKYSFYSGNEAFALTEVMMRKSQYVLTNIEEALQNKEVYTCSFWSFNPQRAKRCRHFTTEAADFDGCVADSFISWVKLKIHPLKLSYKTKTGGRITIPVRASSPYHNHPPPNKYSRITYQVYGNDKLKRYEHETGILLENVLNNNITNVDITLPEVPGNYSVFISVSQDNFPASINSQAVQVQVNE